MTPVTFSQTGSVWLGDGEDGETGPFAPLGETTGLPLPPKLTDMLFEGDGDGTAIRSQALLT